MFQAFVAETSVSKMSTYVKEGISEPFERCTFCFTQLNLLFYTVKPFVLHRKTCLKRPLKKSTKTDFRYRLSFNAGQKYYRAFCNTFDLHQATIFH